MVPATKATPIKRRLISFSFSLSVGGFVLGCCFSSSHFFSLLPAF